MTLRDVGRLLVLPVLLGALAGIAVDPVSPPFSGTERVSAVFLLDGQAYFGHLEDHPWSDQVVLRDVYYFEDARRASTGMTVALVKRGSEVHQPIDVMRIRRDKVLGVERVGTGSPVARAIAAQRALEAR